MNSIDLTKVVGGYGDQHGGSRPSPNHNDGAKSQ